MGGGGVAVSPLKIAKKDLRFAVNLSKKCKICAQCNECGEKIFLIAKNHKSYKNSPLSPHSTLKNAGALRWKKFYNRYSPLILHYFWRKLDPGAETEKIPVALEYINCCSGKKPTFVSAVLQKCFVDIDEVGTEAAAATAVMLSKQSARMVPKIIPVNFHVTSPYIYFIYQPTSGIALFSGVVSNPSHWKNAMIRLMF